MSDDQTSSDPAADELIVPAPREGNPGTADGVGSRVSSPIWRASPPLTLSPASTRTPRPPPRRVEPPLLG
jgi:hypothetical protein